jgi:hypothetical protein
MPIVLWEIWKLDLKHLALFSLLVAIVNDLFLQGALLLNCLATEHSVCITSHSDYLID